MNGKRIAATLVIACFCLVCLSQEAWSGSFSVTATNNIYKISNNSANPCSPVILNYWSGGNVSKAQLPNPLNSYSPQILTVSNVGSCSSIDITASCHFFATQYTNYGKMSQTGWSRWVDETKTQSLSCCTNVSIGAKVAVSGMNADTVLEIKCQ